MQDAKEEVRNRLAIEDVIGEYVQLKRSGRLWRGLSPFTNEHTPSFFVTPDKNIWHDFSANKGGDIYSFVMEVEGLDFRGALELLARKAGVDLSQYDTKNNREFSDKKKRYYEVNIMAKKYFIEQMVKSQTAKNYIVKKRGINKETIIDWGIGYAPDNGGVVNYLRSKKILDNEIRGAGLLSSRGGDMFRSRMMVPLCDSQGQVVGFTGRIIGDGEPKYINTPATLLYDKGRQVFGFHLAKNTIRKDNLAVLVEGNLDVISSYQAGVKNVVACAGTALTNFHLKALKRLTDNIALCFDGDKAGVAATERAILLAQELDINLSVVNLPGDAKDPDELIQKDTKLWQNAINNKRVPAIEWIINHHLSEVDIKTAEGKKKLTNEAIKIISKLSDPVEREHYIKKLASITETEISTIEQKMYSNKNDNPTVLKMIKIEKIDSNRRDENELIMFVFAIAFRNKNLRTILSNLQDNYLTESLARIKYYLRGMYSLEIDSDLTDKLAEIELIADSNEFEDNRKSMLGFLRDIELIETESSRDQLMNVFVSSDDSDEKRREILNGAINGLNQNLKLLKNTGPNDDFEGLFKIWDSRKDMN